MFGLKKVSITQDFFKKWRCTIGDALNSKWHCHNRFQVTDVSWEKELLLGGKGLEDSNLVLGTLL